MKLLQATIHGFGKFYQKTIPFQDGIHVIYGPNESGKSTLHTFLGCMLFGLERGRGRAAKGDLYSRCLPWDHDAAYGGSLSLENDQGVLQIQRNFRSEHRSCRVSSQGQAPVDISQQQLEDHYYEGLTESLYYNTISVRQLGCAPDNTLAGELSRQLTDLHRSGSDTIDYSGAVSWLKAQRKYQESLLDPTLERNILQTGQSLEKLNHRLCNTDFQEQKAALEMDMDHCMEQLAALGQEPAFADPKERDPREKSSGIFPLISLILLAITIFFFRDGKMTPAVAAGIGAFLTFLMFLMRKRHTGTVEVDTDSPQRSADASSQSASASRRLRQQMQSLQKEYETICRKEWDHDRWLEEAQALEEELEQLTYKAAEEDKIRLEIQAISLALTTLQKVSAQMQDTIGPNLNRSMSQILSGLTGGAYSQVYVDGQLAVSVQAGIRTVSLESLSRGTIEQIYLAMRLAVIDLLFPQGGMPLLLDDCFLAYDDDRLTQTLSWLAENYSGQVLIFTCQKREAALLRKEQIPFTMISL